MFRTVIELIPFILSLFLSLCAYHDQKELLQLLVKWESEKFNEREKKEKRKEGGSITVVLNVSTWSIFHMCSSKHDDHLR